MIILSIFFFVTALIYSSVGFGGGSTYLAILLIWGVPYTIFPIIALVCNIIVVSGNSINFIRSKNINFDLLFPYLIGSVPFAFVGGSIKIEKNLFEILLFCVLLVAGIFLLIQSKSFNKEKIKINQIPKLISISIGSIIGFMSGIVGIGGGIFLSPLLFLMKAGYPRHITSSASLFILINSIFGIAGQLTKDQILDQVIIYWPLFLSVLIGGQIGSVLNIKFLPNKILALLTSFLVIFVAIRIGIKVVA
ncbi:sulfite exporter TauE/SafE family protein [Candidatus Pelagibacter sp.]|uniref:sulfite exporter TauE/SafE family protein n=1 Tax=Candidatus Pelagibacter sp. TaxID=2024849 RepID=UPI003F84B133